LERNVTYAVAEAELGAGNFRPLPWSPMYACFVLTMLWRTARARAATRAKELGAVQGKPTTSFVRLPKERRRLHGWDWPELSSHCTWARRRIL